MTPTMEILSIGNELLIGKISNTNATWLCKQATALGVTVKRVTVLPDEIEETAEAIRETLKRKPQFILTTGGLGPTFDDKTLETIAKALARRLEVSEEALRMVREKYEAFATKGNGQSIEMTKARVKMATLPERTVPLRNPVGTAPGMQVNLYGAVLIALPGVPQEMEAIFKETVLPLLRNASKGSVFYEESLFVDIMESALAPLIDVAMRDNLGVYIKSHPKGAENQPHIEIHLSTFASSATEAKERVQKAVIQLAELIEKNNGQVY
jgi:molybdenum cofactor synthesis domain-containing protein